MSDRNDRSSRSRPSAPGQPRKRKLRSPSRLRHLAQCTRGLEPVLAGELRELGSSYVTEVPGGVLFRSDREFAARATFWLRSAVRVLEPVLTGRVLDMDELYELAGRAPWEDLIGTRHTFAVQATLSKSPLHDPNFAALKVKDAIADRILGRRGSRPDVDRQSPDVPIKLVVRGQDAHLFRDLAGTSLHRRGYRPIQVKSPLSEAIAAGLLLLSDWDRSSPLIDPMCGSGTFVLEAAALAADRAPGIARTFAGERFPDSDAEIWRRLREEAADRLRPSLPFPLLGTDVHPGALGIARESARRGEFEKLVRFEVADAAELEPPFNPALVVSNPPWGERIGEGDELVATWRALGSFLRRCSGTSAYVLSGAQELTRHLGLRSSDRHAIRVGQLDARWLRYVMREVKPVE